MDIEFTWKTDRLSPMIERLRNLKRAGRFIRSIKRAAIRVESQAKRNAPVDNGNLRNSITTEQPTMSGDSIMCRVGTAVTYAPYQEFGTGLYGPEKSMYLIQPKNKSVLAWRVKGNNGKFMRGKKGWAYSMYVWHPGTKPHAFLGPAVKSEGPRWAESVMEALIKLAKGSVE